MQFKDHSTLTPCHLNKEEMANPYQVLASFFDYSDLLQHRDALKTLLKVAATGEFSVTLSPIERSNLFTHHCWLEKLVEAAHLICKEKNSK
jgi:hypothetical protein